MVDTCLPFVEMRKLLRFECSNCLIRASMWNGCSQVSLRFIKALSVASSASKLVEHGSLAKPSRFTSRSSCLSRVTLIIGLRRLAPEKVLAHGATQSPPASTTCVTTHVLPHAKTDADASPLAKAGTELERWPHLALSRNSHC